MSNPIEFLSHLSGDEGFSSLAHIAMLFLSHLSGDEASTPYNPICGGFLSHLSGDEVIHVIVNDK